MDAGRKRGALRDALQELDEAGAVGVVELAEQFGVVLVGDTLGFREQLTSGRAQVHRVGAADALADRLAAAAFKRGWVARGSHPRSARLTPTGVHYLHADASATDTHG